MKAARIHEFGRNLQIDDVPEPEPADDEVLAEVLFAGVNPLDVWVTQGTVAGGQQPLPFVPGIEAVGRVSGETVLLRGGGLGVARDGLYREWAAVPRSSAMTIPDGLDPEQAAALPTIGLTAWRMVHDVAGVTGDDRVLVLGASGGVGTIAVQVAKAAGAEVWGQTTSEDKASFLEDELGVRSVVAGADELAASVADLAPTVAIDPLAGPFTGALVTALEPHGRIVVYGASAGPRGELDLRALYRKAGSILTFSATIEPEERNREGLERVLRAAADGELRVFVDEVLPLEQAAEAHRRILDREVRGKLLLRP